MTTQYVRPPAKRQARKQNRPEPELAQLKKFLYRHRDDLAPYWTATAVLLVALIAEPFPLSWLWLLIVYGALALVLYRFGGQVLKLNREIERRYAAGCAAVAGLWSAWMVVGSVQPLAALPILTALVAFPWHKHRNVRASLPVTFAKELTGQPRREAGKRAAAVINGWPQISTQGKIRGATLKALTFDPYSDVVDVSLRSGQSVRSLTYPASQAALESAFGAPPGSLRVEGRGNKDARDVRLRFLRNDPNADGLGAPPVSEEFILGRFETGDPVLFDDRVHTGVFGMTGAGKSVIMNLIIRYIRRRRDWAMVGVDLKPGAPEFSPWGRAWFYLADTPDKARFALESLLAGLTTRGDLMRERGWKTWRATPAEPNVALFIDEVQELRTHGADLVRLLERAAGLGRAYGFRLYLATQYPIDKNLPTTVMEALSQIIGLRVRSDRADRIVFGENATREGWTPSKLPERGGSFLIRNERYQKPVPARSFFLDEDDVEEENVNGPGPVMLDVATAARWVERGRYPGEIPSAREMTPLELEGIRPEEIMDADVVDTARQQVLDAVTEGLGKPADISAATDIPKRTVNDILKALATEELIVQDGPRRPWRAVE